MGQLAKLHFESIRILAFGKAKNGDYGSVQEHIQLRLHTQLRLTPRSRRGPTANRRARLQAWSIILLAGPALCRRSRLNSNVRLHITCNCATRTVFEAFHMHRGHSIPGFRSSLQFQSLAILARRSPCPLLTPATPHRLHWSCGLRLCAPPCPCAA